MMTRVLLQISLLIATFFIGTRLATSFNEIVRPGPFAVAKIDESQLIASAAEEDPLAPMTDVDNATSLDHTGTYITISKSGNMPDTFSDLRYLEIETNEHRGPENSYEPRNIVPRGSVVTSKSPELETVKSLSMVKLSIGVDAISFQTESINDSYFTFVGKFTDDRRDGSIVDLKGQLTRVVKGKKIVVMNAEFTLDGC